VLDAECRPAGRRRATRSELPVALSEDRDGLAVRVHAVDLELGRADHEVGVDGRVVEAAGVPFLG